MAEASKNMVTRLSASADNTSHAPVTIGYVSELSNISADEAGCRARAGSSIPDRRQEKFPPMPHRAGDRAGAPSPRPGLPGRICRRVSRRLAWASSFTRGERLAPYRVRAGRRPFLGAEKPHLSMILLVILRFSDHAVRVPRWKKRRCPEHGAIWWRWP